MRIPMIFPMILLLAACGDTAANNETDSSAAALEEVAAPVEATSTATLPFDMPIMDGARYISGSPKFSAPSKNRGGEAIATIAVKGSPLDIVGYYEKALTEHGFTPKLNKHNDESTATVTGVNDKGETFLVSAMRGGSKSRSGESSAALVATMPK